MGPGSRRRCPPSSPGANEGQDGLLRRLFFVGPLAAATLVAPIRLAPGLAPLPLGRVWDPRSSRHRLISGATFAGSQGVLVCNSVLSKFSNFRMQAVMATLNSLPRWINCSL